MGAVADRRRNRDHRHVDEAAHDARECALHAGDNDNHARGLQAVTVSEQAVDAGHAHIGEQVDGLSHRGNRLDGFLRHGEIARARADDKHVAQNSWLLLRDTERYGPGCRVVPRLRDRFQKCRRLILADPCAEEVGATFHYVAGDRHHLFDGLRLTEDYLGHSLAQRSMMIDRREPDILVRLPLQFRKRRLDVEFARAHSVEHASNAFACHAATSSPIGAFFSSSP